MPITFTRQKNNTLLEAVQAEALAAFSAPQDGMWEAFRTMAVPWAFMDHGKVQGFARVNEENHILQFYHGQLEIDVRNALFKKFIDENSITRAFVGSNNPLFLNTALYWHKKVTTHTYLFTLPSNRNLDDLTVSGVSHESLKKAAKHELETMVAFYHYSVGAPEDWLHYYLGQLIDRGELHYLNSNDQLVGTCEIRSSDTNNRVADVGMVVSPDHRRKGYGAFLLQTAAGISRAIGRTPICSCEASNIGSLKSIQKVGFLNHHTFYQIEL